MTWSQFLYEAACWPFERFQRHVLSWVLCIVLSLWLVHTTLQDGVEGHATCDFAGQWMHGRGFFREEADQLYLVEAGKRWLSEGFKDKYLEDQINDVLKKGGHNDLYEKGIAGALYPPTASVAFSYFAQFTPATAHAVAFFFYLGMCYGSGWIISRITQDRLQWGEATLCILFFPNNFMGLMLGQNHVLSLTILCAGWYCHHRRWPFVAGLVWGLFAYKPVFAVALLLVPIALRSPRWFLGMALSGMLCVAGTLPYTKGLDPWFRWLEVGKQAERLYQIDRNWVWMSRDLVGLPRRKMWDQESFINVWRYNIGVWQPGWSWYYTDSKGETSFSPGVWLFWGDDYDWQKHQRVYWYENEQGQETGYWYLTVIGYVLLGSVAGLTVLISVFSFPRYRDSFSRATVDGVPAIFVLTGSLLCVFHFMHYDLLSFALPLLLGLGQLGQWPLRRRIPYILFYLIWLGRTCAFYFGNGIFAVPWETYLLLILWGWMGFVTWKERNINQPENKPVSEVLLNQNQDAHEVLN